MLFNPKKAQFDHLDERSREIMKKTIDFFETKIDAVEDDLMDQTFDFMVRDFSKFALQLYCKTSSTSKQMEVCMKIIKKPEGHLPVFKLFNAVVGNSDSVNIGTSRLSLGDKNNQADQ